MSGMETSSYLERPLRPLGDVIAARAADDFHAGLKLHECPFKTPHLSKMWRRGWTVAARARAEEKKTTHAA